MKRYNMLMGAYMIVSCVSVSAGAILLRIYSLVPVVLTYITSLAVVILAITASLVLRGSKLALNFGVILAALAILSSATSASHLASMAVIFQGGLITLLDILEILGFYLFPAIYIISWTRQKLIEKERQPESAT